MICKIIQQFGGLKRVTVAVKSVELDITEEMRKHYTVLTNERTPTFLSFSRSINLLVHGFSSNRQHHDA